MSPFFKKRIFTVATIAVIAGTVLGLLGMSYSQGKIEIGLSNTLTSTSTLWALPIGLIFFKDKITLRTLFGTAVAFGGVAPKPWRSEAADAQLPNGAAAVVRTAFADARPTEQNAFKIPLAERTLAGILADAQTGTRS